MNTKIILMLFVLYGSYTHAYSQITDAEKDSLYIELIEDQKNPDKVLHAEPLYIDLIRDLGARKGEKEWNVGLGLTDKTTFDAYEALIEYEWAPVDRLGLEVELPFTFYSSSTNDDQAVVPSNRLNSLKMAAQWSFLVNEARATSMALGYINELELSDFQSFGEPLIYGNVYNPFLVMAKRWGNNMHTLLYTGPKIQHHFATQQMNVAYEANSSFHYMISGTRNFIGVEFNKAIQNGNVDVTIRPQMRLGVADNLLIGIVAGIPVGYSNERLSSFLRLIWEPGHHK